MNVEGLGQVLVTQQVSSRVRSRTLQGVATSLVSASAAHLSSPAAGVLLFFKKHTAQALEAPKLHEGLEGYRDYTVSTTY